MAMPLILSYFLAHPCPQWKGASDVMGHRQLVELYEQSQAPSVLGGANVFGLAMSLSNMGSRVTVLASLLGASLASGNAGKRRREEVDCSNVRCNYCRRMGHYKYNCLYNKNKEQESDKSDTRHGAYSSVNVLEICDITAILTVHSP